jgi:shikimate kinase
MINCEKIVIAGFSGSGKTSLLIELEKTAPDPEWTFTDLDQTILKNHNYSSIAQLVEEKGWEKFRIWEKECLDEWILNEKKGVLSLGGGALTQEFLDFSTRKNLLLCYLHSSFENCWARLNSTDTELRPLVKLGKDEMKKLYQKRQDLFGQINWVISNNNREISILADEFWSKRLDICRSITICN